MAWTGVDSGSSGSAAPASPDLGADQGALSLAQSIARLQHGDKSAQGLADYYLNKYGSQIPKPLLTAAGVQQKGGGGNGILAGFGSALGWVGQQLGRAQQVGYAGIHDVGASIAHRINPDAQIADSGYGNILKAATGHGKMTLGEVVGKPGAEQQITARFTSGLEKLGVPNAPLVGKIGGAGFGVIANVATDPLTLLGGAPREATTGLDILKGAEEGGQLAEGTSAAIRHAGFSSLAPETQGAARGIIKASPQIEAMAAPERTVFGQLGEKLGLLKPQTAEEANAANVARITQGVEQGGQAGIRLAGNTILPTGGLSDALNTVRPIAAAREGLSTLGDKIAPFFSRQAQLTRDIGQAGAEALPAAERAKMAQDALAAKDALVSSKPFVKLPEAEQKLIVQAAEGGKDAVEAIRPQLSEQGAKLLDQFTASNAANAASYINSGLARPASDLTKIQQEAFDAAHAKLVEKAQAPVEGAQAQAQIARQAADAQKAKLAEFEAKVADKKVLSPYEYQRRGALVERVRNAESAATKAEGNATKAVAKAQAGVEKATAVAQRAAEIARDTAARNGTFLKAEGTYVRHYFTDAGQKAYDQLAKDAPAIAKQMTGDLSSLRAGGALKSRVIQGTIPEVNEQWAKIFDKAGIDTAGAKLIEDNPALIMAKSNVEAARAASEVRYLTDLAKVAGKGEDPLVIMGDNAAKLADKAGYVKIPGNIEAYAPQNLIPELKRISSTLQDDAELKSFQKAFRKWDSTWSRYTTSFSMTKRYVGHMFNSFLEGGFPEVGRAMDLQRADAAAVKAVGRAAGPEFEAKFMELAKNPRDAEAYLQATKRGIAQTGIFPQNVEGQLNKGIGTPNAVQEIFPTISKTNPMQKVSAVNKAMDNNIRIGHFLKVYDKTGSFDAAEKSVYKYLFDYSDLTKTERSIKQYARFYTYLRKNTPLQVLGLMEKPGLYAATIHAKQGIMQAFPAQQGGIPQWALEAGGVPTSAGVIGMDMPFEHAAKAITPALQTAAMLPGVNRLLPSGLKPEGGYGEVARGILGNFSGGPVSAVKAGVEQATGHSLSTGAPIAKIGTDRIRQVINQLVPATSKLNPIFNARGGNILGQLATKIANINYTPGTSTVGGTEFKRQARAIADSIAAAKAQGIVIPDTAQLQLLHLVPSQAQAIISERLDQLAKKKPVVTAAQKLAAAKAKVKA